MKILAIGAHQDDNEFRLGGLAYRWARSGHEVKFLSMCNGSGGHHIMTPRQTSARRAKESQSVADYLGITYDIWDIDDCTLMPDLETRFRLIRYIREFNPDLVIAHRTNDYHADHRASAQLVQDASYLLTVPHTCPDTAAMRRMPVIVYSEDTFKCPPFIPDIVVDIGEELEAKLHISALNESQVFEWLPYTRGEAVPTNPQERDAWFRGIDYTDETTDEDVLNGGQGYEIRCAKTASRHRRRLIELYGEEKGSEIRYAEAFMLSEYGSQPSCEFLKELFGI